MGSLSENTNNYESMLDMMFDQENRNYQYETPSYYQKPTSSSSSPYHYRNHVVVSPPLTPTVSHIPNYYTMDHQDLLHQKWNENHPTLQGSSSNSSTNAELPHKHACQFQFCGWSFKRYEHLKRHMLVHTGERPHVCHFPGCGKSFSRSDNFHAHYRTHTKKRQPNKKRSGKPLEKINDMLESQKKKKKLTMIRPNNNNNNSSSMASIVAANAAVVAVSQQLNQNISGQVYYNPNVYDHQPLEINHYFMDPSFQMVPMMNFDLRQQEHSPMSPVLSPTPSLLNHQPNTFAKSHICPVVQCSRRFKRLEHLKRHMRIHTLEKPFRCTFLGCQKSFSRSDNLSQHTKTHQKHEDKRKKKKST